MKEMNVSYREGDKILLQLNPSKEENFSVEINIKDRGNGTHFSYFVARMKSVDYCSLAKRRLKRSNANYFCFTRR